MCTIPVADPTTLIVTNPNIKKVTDTMKKISLAAAAVMSMSSAAYASDILGNESVSSLSRSEMSAIQGEGGSITIVQTNEQTNTNTGGTAQQANQNIQQIGVSNVAVNELSQEQTITTTTTTTTTPAKPEKPKTEKPKFVKKEWHWKWHH
jgi:mannitol-specific phosphotransferase system IIBC component